MPLILESYDSLPYIDPDISEAERKNATALIGAELDAINPENFHPSLDPLPEPRFSEAISKELERIAAKEPRQGGVDLSRYEAPDDPGDGNDNESWRQALRSAYVSSSYLSGRHINLALLEELGKNAWLVSNYQIEEILKDLEGELARLKEETENVNKARKAAQEGSGGEIVGLEEAWRRGVGKIVEVQVATEGLRQEMLLRRRG